MLTSIYTDRENYGKQTLNRRGVMRVLENILPWKEVDAIRELGVNLYAIFSKSKKSMDEASKNGPWSVMGSCFNLKMWEMEQVVQDICFSKVVPNCP